ncbi:uncharacterized protein LOC136068361 [Quercus suber]|uniref:uncharacterized protein LOC136068361 n=1 Tax=Quercus suber TaxID=58331 RepID=UPI0032E01489
MKNSGKPFNRWKFSSSKGDRKEFKKKDGKDSQSLQGIVCYECNGHGHLKKECPNYLREKGKAYATTLCDLDSEESCDREGNYFAFMTISHVESSEDLSLLVEEPSEHGEVESMGVLEESDAKEDESAVELQENYNSLLEKLGENTRVAKAAVKKMKKAEEDYRSLLVRYKEAKCEIETLNGELTEAYSKIKFLELEVVQANAKIEQVSSKKLDEVFSHQKPFSDKTGLGYTGESSLSVNISKEVKFVKAKELKEVVTTAEKVKVVKNRNVANQWVLNKPHNQSVVRSEAKGKSLPKSQRGLGIQHFCYHYGLRGHTRPNYHKLRALNNASDQKSRGPRNDKMNWAVEQLNVQIVYKPL